VCTEPCSARAQSPKTLGDELDKAGLPWRFYTNGYRVPLWRLFPGISKPYGIIFYDGLENDVLTPQKRFLTDVKAGKLAIFTSSRRFAKNSDHPGLRRRRRTVVGLVDRERSGREQVLGFYGHLSSSGMIGAGFTIPFLHPHRGYGRLGLPRWVDRNFAVCEERLRFRTFSVRDGQRAAFCGRHLRTRAVWPMRTRAPPRLPAIVLTSTRRRASSCRLKRPWMRRFSYASRFDPEFPTKSEGREAPHRVSGCWA